MHCVLCCAALPLALAASQLTLGLPWSFETTARPPCIGERVRLDLGHSPAFSFLMPRPFLVHSCQLSECQVALAAVKSEAAQHCITGMAAAHVVVLEVEAAEKNGGQLSLPGAG